jgi:hypothetical protein
MNGKFMSMNLQLHRALLSCDISHIDVPRTSSIARDDYTMHGLHLNSQGKTRLMQIIAERVVGGQASGINSIPVITHARASPFFS